MEISDANRAISTTTHFRDLNTWVLHMKDMRHPWPLVESLVEMCDDSSPGLGKGGASTSGSAAAAAANQLMAYWLTINLCWIFTLVYRQRETPMRSGCRTHRGHLSGRYFASVWAKTGVGRLPWTRTRVPESPARFGRWDSCCCHRLLPSSSWSSRARCCCWRSPATAAASTGTWLACGCWRSYSPGSCSPWGPRTSR